MTAAFSHLSIREVLALPFDLYRLLQRNAWIERCLGTEKGREYLKDAHRLTVTEPDYDKLRQMPGYMQEVV